MGRCNRNIPMILVVYCMVNTILIGASQTDPPCDALPSDCELVHRSRCEYRPGQTCGMGTLEEVRLCDGLQTIVRQCCLQKCPGAGECSGTWEKEVPCTVSGEVMLDRATDEEACWGFGCCWDPNNQGDGRHCHMKRQISITCGDVYPDCEEESPSLDTVSTTTDTTTMATTRPPTTIETTSTSTTSTSTPSPPPASQTAPPFAVDPTDPPSSGIGI